MKDMDLTINRKDAMELVSYILKRLKSVATDLEETGHPDLSKILFVKAAEIDEAVCKLETKDMKEAFNEVRIQGYNQALTDICNMYPGTISPELIALCGKLKK